MYRNGYVFLTSAFVMEFQTVALLFSQRMKIVRSVVVRVRKASVPTCINTVLIMLNVMAAIVDRCSHGNVSSPLLGGASESEGIVQVCVNGTYLPVSLDNGRFSVKEATTICRHLGKGIMLSWCSSILLSWHSSFWGNDWCESRGLPSSEAAM